MADASTWPNPLLPLRHRTRREPSTPEIPLLGFLTRPFPSGPVVVRLGNFCGVKDAEFLPTEVFESIDACVSAGWTVD